MLHMQETPSHYPCQVQRCFSSWLLLPLQSTGLNFPLDQLLTKGLSPFLQASITPLLFLKWTKIICFLHMYLFSANYASLSSSDWSITLADTDHEKLTLLLTSPGVAEKEYLQALSQSLAVWPSDLAPSQFAECQPPFPLLEILSSFSLPPLPLPSLMCRPSLRASEIR